jgi:hypothetical protein
MFLPLTSFTKHKIENDGLDRHCKQCRSQEHKEYYITHREQISQQFKKYYEVNPEPKKERAKRYFDTHHEQCRHRQKEYRERLRSRAFEHISDKIECSKCGETDLRVLNFHHNDGGGTKDRGQLESSLYYKRIQRLPIEEARIKFQILCANCHAIKHYEIRNWRG